MNGFDTPEDLPDDDPEVLAGMKRLAELRATEKTIPDVGVITYTD